MRLDEVCRNITDCEHKTAPIDESGEYFAVGTPAMRDHLINYDEARRISRRTFENWTRRLRPLAGDLLLAREAPVGPVVLLPNTENVAPGQRTVLLRPDPNVTSSRFLYYLLRSPRMQAELLVKADGSTVHHLNVADIRSLEVTLPSLPAQQAIAEVLGALDDKIAANTALAATSVEHARQSFKVSITHPDAIALPIEQILNHRAGKYLAKSDYVEAGRVVIYGSNSVMGFHDIANIRGPFSVLARIGSYCGSLQWSQTDAWVNNNASALVAKPGVDPYLLRFALDSVDMSAHKAGSGQPFIRIESLLSDQVSWPPVIERSHLVARIAAASHLELSLTQENRTLAATRDALLPQLMSGKIRVRDAERVAAEAGV